MSPTPIPVELNSYSYPTIDKFVGDPHALQTHLWSNIKMTNTDPKSVPELLAKVDQAMTIAKETKIERDKTKDETAKQLMSKIDELLNPKRPNPPGEQPPTLPTLPPTTSQ